VYYTTWLDPGHDRRYSYVDVLIRVVGWMKSHTAVCPRETGQKNVRKGDFEQVVLLGIKRARGIS
jgi:hypothetical protein